KGWFSSKVRYNAYVLSAEGLYSGTPVPVSGLRAGSVDVVELISNDKVKIHFHVLERYAAKIRKDSVLKVIRPVMIGEKVIEITLGSEQSPVLKALSEMN